MSSDAHAQPEVAEIEDGVEVESEDEVIDVDDDENEDEALNLPFDFVVDELREQRRLHEEWAKENAASYPAVLPDEPDPTAVEQMRLVLEAAEAICRNMAFDQDHKACESHRWNEALRNLQSKLKYLSAAAETVAWNPNFVRLLRSASLIQMRPLHSSEDKDLLRSYNGKCAVCNRREQTCQWGFDMATIDRREGTRFLDSKGVRFGNQSVAWEQKQKYEVPCAGPDVSLTFFGRFATGKTCLRKVHLAFWANNFLPYLYDWIDDQLSEHIPTASCEQAWDGFYVATVENARFFVKEIEAAEHALRTDSPTARLPELPARFRHLWGRIYRQFLDEHEIDGSPQKQKKLQRVLGERAKKALLSLFAPVNESSGEEDDEEDDPSYEDDEEDELRGLIVRYEDDAGKDSVSRRTRRSGAKPDAMCDDPDKYAVEVHCATEASVTSAEEDQRQGRTGDAAPAQKRKASHVEARTSDEDDDAEEGDSASLACRVKRRRGPNRRVVTDNEENADDEESDVSKAIQHSFATQREEEERKWEAAKKCASQRTGSCNHEASCSSDVQQEQEEGSGDRSEALDGNGANKENTTIPEHDAVVATQRRSVHLVLAIGHDMAAEELRKEDPNWSRATRRREASLAVAERLSREFGLGMFGEEE